VERLDPTNRLVLSRIFNGTVRRATGVKLHDMNCGFKAYRREVLREVHIYGELHRFVPVLAHARGFRVGEIEGNHRARSCGRSKYGSERFVTGLLAVLTVRFLTRFSTRPLRTLGGLGLLLLTLGGLGLVYLAIVWLWPENRPIGHRPLLVYSATLLGIGSQFLCLGILAELVTFYQIRQEDQYSIAQTTNLDGRLPGDDPGASNERPPPTR
jgi:hypothetical protein